jgi:endonuclease III
VERREILDRLLARHGRTYADEIGIRTRSAGPDELFQLLVAALLLSARISADIAVASARELCTAGYGSPRAMSEASWQDRVDALGRGGYRRYDERTATQLGEAAALVVGRYDGDLDGLRRDAGGDPEAIRRRLQEVKGIGPTGADIFCRDAQTAWSELRPFVDAAALDVADELGLPTTPQGLAELQGDDDLALVASALVRARDLDVVRDGDEDAPPTPTQLATASRAELYELARRADVPGRSSMSRDELAEALRT